MKKKGKIIKNSLKEKRMDHEKRSNLFTLFISVILLFVVSAILALCRLLWFYYSLGAILSIFTHLLMMIQNRRFFRIQQNDVEKVTYAPKKDSFLWYGLRILVIASYLVGLVFLAKALNPNDMLECVLLTLAGFMTVKVVFILILIFYKEGR
jgi:hypothetical protein